MKSIYRNSLLLILILLVTDGVSQSKKYMRRAESGVYSGQYEKAKKNYLKAIEAQPNNYEANLNAGYVISENLESYQEALPYLEKALKLVATKDTSGNLLLSLAKCYHHLGKYNEALKYYDLMKRFTSVEDRDLFPLELEKRAEDCKYALDHPEQIPARQLYVVNAGKSINTPMTERIPLITPNNQLVFTSRRKDSNREKVDSDNGKYHESMYLSSLKNGYTSVPKILNPPIINVNSKDINADESVIAMIPGGKKMYFYIADQIYQAEIKELKTGVKTLVKVAEVTNLDPAISQACISSDGKTMYYISDAKEGTGGDDIYKATRRAAGGSWGKPENLGPVINTVYDEESPFISDDGKTLYFASNGLPGYGDFDLYKSTLQNGKWTAPVNLGLPINSPSNDMFFSTNKDGSLAYFTSSRVGGIGDMDIYKINYTSKLSPDSVNAKNNALSINIVETPENIAKFKLSAVIPDDMKDKMISFTWLVNDYVISADYHDFVYDFGKEGQYTITAKMIAGCDTCINPYKAYCQKTIEIKRVTDSLGIIASKSVDLLTAKNNSFAVVEKAPVIKEVISDPATIAADKTSNTAKAKKNAAAINFEFGKTKIKVPSYIELDDMVAILNQNPDYKLIIEGHADSRDTEEKNQIISEKRAVAVKFYLMKKGIIKSRLKAIGYGERKPIESNETPEGRAANRRVQLVLVY